jgi:hypothetical protein
MPRAQQKRLQVLLDKQDSGELGRAEATELRRLLKEVELKTIELLERASRQAQAELKATNASPQPYCT